MPAAPPGPGSSVDDVVTWFAGIGLSRDYAAALRDNGIDGEVLGTLQAGDLEEIGVDVAADRGVLAAALGVAAAALPVDGSDVDAVVRWMGSLALTRDYAAHIRENDVDGAVLRSLSKEELKEALGVTVFGDRRKVELALGLTQPEGGGAAPAQAPRRAPLPSFRKMMLWVDTRFDHLQGFIDEMERQLGVTFEKRTSTSGAERVLKFYGGQLAAVITNRQRGDDAEAGYALATVVSSMWAKGEAATGGRDAPPVVVMYSTSADTARCAELGMRLCGNFQELQRVLTEAVGRGAQ